MPGSVFVRFIVNFPDISTDGKFLLRDLPGSGNRIDVLCRSLSACFDWGPTEISPDRIEFRAVLSNNLTLIFQGPKNPANRGEVDWAIDIREVLRGNPPEYVSVRNMSLENNLNVLLDKHPSSIWLLQEDAENDIQKWKAALQNTFILGNHKGFDSSTLKLARDHDIPRLSVGPLPYLGSHCVASVIKQAEKRENNV